MPPLGQRVVRLSRDSQTKQPVWKIDGRQSTTRFSSRDIKFFPWDEKTMGEAPRPAEPKRGDWAILIPDDSGQASKPGRAHLVPAGLLDHEGGVYCFDDSITDGNKWVQVLPVDKKGKPVLLAVTGCTLWWDPEECRHGDVIAIQAVPDTSVAGTDDDEIEDFTVRVTSIHGRHCHRWAPDLEFFAITTDDEDATGADPGSDPASDPASDPGSDPGSGNGSGSAPATSLDDDDDDDDADSDDEDALSDSYEQIKIPASKPKNPRARAKTAVKHAKKLSALAVEAQKLRRDAHASQQAKTKFRERAEAVGEGIVQFFEEGAPSPTFGTTSVIGVASWGFQIAETPEPPGGWGNVDATYSAPETPVSDGFGSAGTIADVTCLVVALAKSIWNIQQITNDKDLSEDERNTRVVSEMCNIGTYIGHLGVAGIGIADMAYSGYVAAQKATLSVEAFKDFDVVAQQTSQHLSIATGVVGTVVGVYVTARNTRKAVSAGLRGWKVQKLHLEALLDDENIDLDRDHDWALIQHLTFAEKKLHRKTVRTALTATSALIGTASSAGGLAVAAVGTVALANIWNPIGWSLFAAGLGIGLGVTAYVVIRGFPRFKRLRHEHRRDIGRPVNAHMYAINLAEAYLDPGFKKKQREHWNYIERLLTKTGVTDKKLNKYSQMPPAEGFRKLVKLIERKVT